MIENETGSRLRWYSLVEQIRRNSGVTCPRCMRARCIMLRSTDKVKQTEAALATTEFIMTLAGFNGNSKELSYLYGPLQSVGG